MTMITSIRLPKSLEVRLRAAAASQFLTKSRVILIALERYLDEFDSKRTSFDLGKDLFGTVGSGREDLSARYKTLVKETLRDKRAD
jgi:predicted DNA-binding protein